MIWDQHCLVIVMTTKTMERGRIKCHQYWSSVVGDVNSNGDFEVKTVTIDASEEYTLASLEVKNLKTDETRNVSHWQVSRMTLYLCCVIFFQ